MLPANIGGTHWGGVSYDPARGIVVVPNNRLPAVVTLIPREKWKVMREKLTSGERVGKEFTDMQGTPYVMQREIWLSSRRSPCTAPPFGIADRRQPAHRQDAVGRAAGHRTKGSTRSACRNFRRIPAW